MKSKKIGLNKFITNKFNFDFNLNGGSSADDHVIDILPDPVVAAAPAPVAAPAVVIPHNPDHHIIDILPDPAIPIPQPVPEVRIDVAPSSSNDNQSGGTLVDFSNVTFVNKQNGGTIHIHRNNSLLVDFSNINYDLYRSNKYKQIGGSILSKYNDNLVSFTNFEQNGGTWTCDSCGDILPKSRAGEPDTRSCIRCTNNDDNPSRQIQSIPILEDYKALSDFDFAKKRAANIMNISPSHKAKPVQPFAQNKQSSPLSQSEFNLTESVSQTQNPLIPRLKHPQSSKSPLSKSPLYESPLSESSLSESPLSESSLSAPNVKIDAFVRHRHDRPLHGQSRKLSDKISKSGPDTESQPIIFS